MILIIGIDPGPTPGLVAREYCSTTGWFDILTVLQCNHQSLPYLLSATLDLTSSQEQVLIAVEEFVVGHRAARSATASAGKATRDLIGRIQNVVDYRRQSLQVVRLVTNRAADVKPWARDDRLRAAGLYDATNGMRHARDAARHLLFAAVRDAGAPDPLRKERVVSP